MAPANYKKVREGLGVDKNDKRLIYGPWPYWVGSIILAVLNILVLILQRKPWGVTSIIEAWTRWAGSLIGILQSKHSLDYLVQNVDTYVNIGIVLGAFLSVLVASQARFRPIRDIKFFFSALVGGSLMGYGARIAYGCNIGALLNGISSFSLTGWIFAAAVFGGAYIGGKLLVRFFI